VAISLLDTTPADARRSGGGGGSSAGRSASHVTTHRSAVVRSTHRSQVTTRRTAHHERQVKHERRTRHERSLKKEGTSTVESATVKGIHNLPISKAVAGTSLLKARLAVPQNLHPKLTLSHAPGLKFRPRFAPFVQRFWKRPFFWVVIAGIGYVTIPEFYYDPFYSCIGVDDPIYDDCLYILSYAALEDDEVVRLSMPASAVYRYRAKAPVTSDCRACRWDPYVERKWNQSYAWVKIPETGNVTVPDAVYDRFHGFVAANPPDYPRACLVLQDAASAKDESAGARVSMPPGTEYRYQADTAPTQECKSCSLEPFVERKWNHDFVWVQVPQTGNVTVPEDSYDRFYQYASADPPNYAGACKVLTEAVAADTVMATSMDTQGSD
jgi:hypothetical protein